MVIEHNSREQFYRYPFGAVTCGTEVRFRLSVSGVGIPSAVRFVYKQDEKEEVRVDMPYMFDVGDHCVYSVNVKMPDEAGLIWYYFELATERGMVYYGNNSKNLGGRGEMCFEKPNNSYQITVYNEDYKTPDLFKEGVAYQIFVDRFCNGDPTNDVETNEYCYINEPVHKVSDWNRYPAQMDVREFYGGDLQG
ncbi:MAG: hypothetical protein IJX57_03070, partial [Clostridia bacterium]|nr:hypothetical protein [Clostridia bacterium]